MPTKAELNQRLVAARAEIERLQQLKADLARAISERDAARAEVARLQQLKASHDRAMEAERKRSDDAIAKAKAAHATALKKVREEYADAAKAEVAQMEAKHRRMGAANDEAHVKAAAELKAKHASDVLRLSKELAAIKAELEAEKQRPVSRQTLPR